MSSNGYTPTQQKILDKLADGLGHGVEEILSEIGLSKEELARETLRVHISNLRRKLRDRGMSVLFERSGYRLVRLIAKGE